MNVYRIDGAETSLVLSVQREGLCVDYLGSRLPDSVDLSSLPSLTAPVVPHGELDGVVPNLVFPTAAGRPVLMPALSLTRSGQALDTELSVTGIDAQETMLRATLTDTLRLVEVEYRAEFLTGDVLEFNITLHNTGTDPLGVAWLASVHLPLPAHFCRAHTHGGFWANEFLHRESLIGDQVQIWESSAGRSGHASSASIVVGGPHLSNQHGEALQIALSWPGNHRLAVGPGPGSCEHAVQAGIRLEPGELILGAGEDFAAPPVLVTHTSSGMNGLRKRMQTYWAALSRNAPATTGALPQRGTRRLVHFNTWEAAYFDHNEAGARALIQEAAALGAERFILDDGWMAGRSDAGLGLGDWQPCPRRYPRGLRTVADAARAAGLEFGLWVEPEMVTDDSALARDHPDWIIQRPDRTPITGRGQRLLNLCLTDVQDYLRATLARLVEETGATYLKWDMNRNYAEIGPGSQSSAVSMTRAWMEIVTVFRADHPQVDVELCAAGGARSDVGSMHLADRLWPSDSMDPIQRFRLLEQASLILPPTKLGWHVGSARSETSGAILPLATRCALARLGHLGLELNPADLSDDDRDAITRAVAEFKKERDWLGESLLYALDSPDPGVSAILRVSPDAAQALLFLVRVAYPARGGTACLRLPYLDENVDYRLERDGSPDTDFAQSLAPWHKARSLTCSGALLINAGLRLPPLQYAQAEVIRFERL